MVEMRAVRLVANWVDYWEVKKVVSMAVQLVAETVVDSAVTMVVTTVDR